MQRTTLYESNADSINKISRQRIGLYEKLLLREIIINDISIISNQLSIVATEVFNSFGKLLDIRSRIDEKITLGIFHSDNIDIHVLRGKYFFNRLISIFFRQLLKRNFLQVKFHV